MLCCLCFDNRALSFQDWGHGKRWGVLWRVHPARADVLAFFPQTQNRAAYYPPSQIAQLRPSPRWTAQGARPHRKPLLVTTGIGTWGLTQRCNTTYRLLGCGFNIMYMRQIL